MFIFYIHSRAYRICQIICCSAGLCRSFRSGKQGSIFVVLYSPVPGITSFIAFRTKMFFNSYDAAEYCPLGSKSVLMLLIDTLATSRLNWAVIPVVACAQREGGVAVFVFYISAHRQAVFGLCIRQCNGLLQKSSFCQHTCKITIGRSVGYYDTRTVCCRCAADGCCRGCVFGYGMHGYLRCCRC